MLDLLGEHGTIKTEIVRWWYIGLLCGLCLKKAVYREYAVFFMLKVYRFVAEIISTIRVANAIINDNASYTLMLITAFARETEYIELSHGVQYTRFTTRLQGKAMVRDS